jgi:hypothetical protein
MFGTLRVEPVAGFYKDPGVASVDFEAMGDLTAVQRANRKFRCSK